MDKYLPEYLRLNENVPTTEDSVIRLLRQARELSLTEESANSLVLALFQEDITPDEARHEKERLEKWSLRALTKQRSGLEVINDETVTTAITMNRARDFWRHGLMFSKDKQDIDVWLTIVSRHIFATIADRTIVYPEEATSSKQPAHKRLGECNGVDLFDAIVRLSGNDNAYLKTMAHTLNNLTSEDITQALKEVIKGFTRHAVGIFKREGARFQTAHHSQGYVAADIIGPDLYLALEVAHLQGMSEQANTPSAILAKLEFLKVNPQTKSALKTLQTILPEALMQEDPENRRRESLDFMRGAIHLLFSSFEFTASSEGLGSKNARVMHQFLHNASSQPGRQSIPSRKSLVILANRITPLLNQVSALSGPAILDIKAPYDTFYAINRLFEFIKYEAAAAENSEVSELIETAEDCALRLADYGLKQPTYEFNDMTPHLAASVLADEPGPKAQRNALHRLGKPGYGKMS